MRLSWRAPGSPPRCARVNKATAGGLVEGRRLARVVGLPGADRGTQKSRACADDGLSAVHADRRQGPTGDFADPEVVLPKAPAVDPFADDPVDLENKVVALLKP